MTFPEAPDIHTGKAPEHQENALKVHAQKMQSMGKSTINPSKKEYLIAWKDLSKPQAIWIKERVRDNFKIFSTISTDWRVNVFDKNYMVVIDKQNPLTIEEARAINNDIDDTYKLIGTIYVPSSGGVTTPVIINTNPSKEEKEKIASNLLEEILNKIVSKKIKPSTKEKIFTVPNDVTEREVLIALRNLGLGLENLRSDNKVRDDTYDILWLKQTSDIADEIIKSKKNDGYKINSASYSTSTPNSLKSEIIYMVKSILFNKFDEMDKDKKPIPTDEEVAMQQAWGSGTQKPATKKSGFECFFCKKKGISQTFNIYVELKNHIETVHGLTRSPGLKGNWVPITAPTQTKTPEEQIKELEDELIKSHTKPNETWVYVPMVEVAKLVRNVLKIYYPTQKFSVRKSGGSAINVDWSGGPSEKEIDTIIGKYHHSDFDAMTDSTVSLNRPWGNSYIFLHKGGE